MKIVVLENAFPAEDAERLRTFLETGGARWHYSFAETGAIPDSIDHIEKIRTAAEVEDRMLAAGRLGFRFRRTLDHTDCSCCVCNSQACFRQREVIDRIEKAMGLSDLTLSSIFASLYTEGDFLSPHSDRGNGRVAFVWNLTRDWRPQFGGNLHILDATWMRVERVIVPDFNSLVLFDVQGDGWPHFVSHVAPGVTHRRLAMSGWYR